MPFCCESMAHEIDRRCLDGHDIWECADNVVQRLRDGRFALIIHDGGTSGYVINFCPWCGRSLGGKEDEQGNVP